MVDREPRYQYGLLTKPEYFLNRHQVMHEVAVGNHDPFGSGSRTGSVLKKRNGLAGDFRLLPTSRRITVESKFVGLYQMEGSLPISGNSRIL